MTIYFTDPVDSGTAAGVCFVAGAYFTIASLAIYSLFRNRNSRIIKARSPYLMSLAIGYGLFFVLVFCSSYITGKTEASCLAMSVALSFDTTFYSFTYMLIYPTMVFESILNKLKEERAQGIKDWKWMFHGVFSVKMKVIYILIYAGVQLMVFLSMRAALPNGWYGGENGLEPAGEEDNCFRRELVGGMITSIFALFLLFYFITMAQFINDPYYLKVELVSLNLIITPWFVAIAVYSFAPQVFGPHFDFRFVPIAYTITGFFSGACPIILLSYKSIEDRVLRSVQSFQHWRTGIDMHGRLEMEDVSNETLLALQEGVDVFKIVLENPILLEGFIEYATKDWCVENVLFYKDVEQFKNTYEQTTPEARMERAKKIVDEFVANGSPLEINIEHAPRLLLVKKVKQGLIEESMFNKAQKHIFELMKKDSFDKWQKTVEYKQFLKKAVHNRQTSGSQFESTRQSVTLTVETRDEHH